MMLRLFRFFRYYNNREFLVKAYIKTDSMGIVHHEWVDKNAGSQNPNIVHRLEIRYFFISGELIFPTKNRKQTAKVFLETYARKHNVSLISFEVLNAPIYHDLKGGEIKSGDIETPTQ